MPTDSTVLLVINQDTDLRMLGELCCSNRFNRVMILSTHKLFGFEEAEFRKGRDLHVEVGCFGEFLDDKDMAECDVRATEYALGRCKAESARSRYVDVFESASLFNKNQLVREKILAKFRVEKVFYDRGLGISAACWQSVGVPLRTSCGCFTGVKRAFEWIGRVGRCRYPIVVHRLLFHGQCFVFFGSINRLSLIKDGVSLDSFKFAPFKNPWLWTISRTSQLKRVLKRIVKNEAATVCCAMHEYRPDYARLSLPLEVFADGYLPSNYPRSYFDSYVCRGFVVRDMVGAALMKRHGFNAVMPYGFLKAEFMSVPVKLKSVSKVCLVMNHAGDWTALINRSDSDVLIERFCDLASQMPGTGFLIRLHPTMVHPRHEGLNSVARIHRYVEQRGIANLAISHRSMEEDLADADFFVSEYSNVLLEAWKRGKLAASVNLTTRRSFTDDYDRMGFLCAGSVDDFRELVAEVVRDPGKCVDRQAAAAQEYNRQLREFLG